jgi:HlyD family secretion protein
VVSYKAIVSFENEQIEGQNLIPGMTANVTLVVKEKNDVSMVQNAALRFRPITKQSEPPEADGARRRDGRQAITSADEPPRGPSVYKLDEKGEPLRVDVETGITDGINTEIISGVEDGTEVIVGIDIPRDA